MNIENQKNLSIHVFPTRKSMGIAASNDVEKRINALLKIKDEIRMVFAAAPSQNEILDCLVESKTIDWNRITAFHMDEYIGLPAESEQLFSAYLKNRLFDKVPFKHVYTIDGNNDIALEMKRYSGLIAIAPIDIICLGIGENGHIAFNDPPFADFNDPLLMKEVTLDQVCRKQQVNDGCFPSLDLVPQKALTLTIPVFMQASHLFCVVPGINKRNAVGQTITGPVTTSCPASVLQRHPDCNFYFDEASCDLSLLK
ncbi:MAG TPA: glucosamine-6-phosphate deaminase [Bacteroidales bacterium]|nr:glucosamine-6-phosphate deaminase [Bacteroidales bacterium]HPT20746.1 glucosamine-6-phosphate deaminase [Bacteroidales bacterium]